MSSVAGNAPRTGHSMLPRLNGWLIWKETRLLLPASIALLVMVAAVVAGQIWLSESDTKSLEQRLELTLVVLPGLFATGVGAVLVGQERESGTVQWLATLPLSPKQLVLSKYLMGAIGLLCFWLLAIVGIEVLGSTSTQSRWGVVRPRADGLTPISYPCWAAHSCFVMLAGFYCAWRIKNQFHAMLAIVALAAVPIVLAGMLGPIAGEVAHRPLHTTEPIAWLLVSTVGIPIVGLLGYRRAIKVLAPQSGDRFDVRFPTVRVAKTNTASRARIPQYRWPTAGLVWHAARSSRVVLAILAAMLLVGVFVPLRTIFAHVEPNALVGLAALAASWLGVLVFKQDGRVDRVRFLADRGVSPRKVYCCLHAVPVALISSVVVAYTMVATYLIVNYPNEESTFALPSMLVIAASLGILYSVSQWLSQLIRASVLSFILAPLLSGVALGWAMHQALDSQVSFGSLLVVWAVPLLATWWLMPRYIDGRDRPLSYFVAALVVAVLLLVPYLSATWTADGMSRRVKAGLLSEGLSLKSKAPPSINLEITIAALGDELEERKHTFEEANAILATRAETPEQFIQGLDQLKEHPQHAASLEFDRWGELHNRLMLERVILQAAADGESVGRQQIDEFAEWLDAASVLADALRRSVRWCDQEIADRLEIWLLDTLTSQPLETFRSEPFYQSVVARLPVSKQRNKSRRTAVLASWASWSEQTPGNKLPVIVGGISLDNTRADVGALAKLKLADAHVESIVLQALKPITTTIKDTSDQAWLRRMHDLVIGPNVPLELGGYSPELRQLDAMMSLRLSQLYREPRYLQPTRFWGMSWEKGLDNLIAVTKPANVVPSADETGERQ